jgi:hypothetical protein
MMKFPIHGKIKNVPNHQTGLYSLGSLGSPYLPWDTKGYDTRLSPIHKLDNPYLPYSWDVYHE